MISDQSPNAGDFHAARLAATGTNRRVINEARNTLRAIVKIRECRDINRTSLAEAAEVTDWSRRFRKPRRYY
jgi:hypothetical protein